MSKSTINNWGFYFDIENQQILNEDNIVFLNCFQQCPIITCNMENQLYDKNITLTQTVKNTSSNNREPPKINKPIDETSYVINYDLNNVTKNIHGLTPKQIDDMLGLSNKIDEQKQQDTTTSYIGITCVAFALLIIFQ